MGDEGGRFGRFPTALPRLAATCRVRQEGGDMVEPEGVNQDELCQGSGTSKFFGFLSFLALGYAVLELVLFRWWVALMMFAGSIVTGYIAYRLACGRRKIALLRMSWKNKRQIDVVSEPCGSWPQKVKLMFEALAEDAEGDYALAVRRLHVKDAPQEVRDALARAEASPTADNWNRLREAMLRNPPVS